MKMNTKKFAKVTVPEVHVSETWDVFLMCSHVLCSGALSTFYHHQLVIQFFRVEMNNTRFVNFYCFFS